MASSDPFSNVPVLERDIASLATSTSALLQSRHRRRWLARLVAVPLIAIPTLLILDAGGDLSPLWRTLALLVIAGGMLGCLAWSLRRIQVADPLASGEAAIGEFDRRFTAAQQLGMLADARAQAHASQLAAQLPSAEVLSPQLLLGLPAARAWQPLAMAGATLVAFGVIAWALPNLLPACAPRLWDPWGDHPPYSATRLTWVDPPSESRYNEPTVLTVAFTGPAPRDLILHAAYSDSAVELPGETHLLPAGANHWQVRLESPTHALRLWVAGAGTRTRWLDLSLDGVPRLRGALVSVIGPTYANLPTAQIRCLSPSVGSSVPAVSSSTVSLLAGSSLTYELACSRMPVAVWLQQEGALPERHLVVDNANPDLPLTERRDAVARLTVPDPAVGTWSVSLEGPDGTRSAPTTLLTITRRIDHLPTARIMMPDDGAYATPGITVPLQVQATDDLGLAQLTLYRLIGDKQVSEGRHSLGGTGDTWRGSVKLDDVKPGDKVRLGAVVRDSCPPAGQVSAPAEVTLTIIALDTFLALAREQLDQQALMTRFAPVFEKLATLEEEARRVADAPPSPERTAQLAALEKKLAEARAKFAEQAKLELFAADGEVFRAVDERLAELEQAAQKGFPTGSGQDQAKALTDDLDHLTAAAEADAAQDWIKDLATAERRMATEFSDLAKNQVPSDMQRARMRELARQQGELEEALNELKAQSESISERLAKHDPQQAEHLKQLAEALGQAATPAGDAARQAARGRAQPASTGADSTATMLENLVKKRRDGQCKNGWCNGDKLGQCRSQLAAMAKAGMGKGGSPHSSGGGGALGSFGGGRYVRRGGDAAKNPGKQLYGPISTLASASDKRGGPKRDGKGGSANPAGAGTADPTPHARSERTTTAGIGATLTPDEEHLIDDYYRGLEAPSLPLTPPAAKPTTDK